jgi:hypothetical protein
MHLALTALLFTEKAADARVADRRLAAVGVGGPDRRERASRHRRGLTTVRSTPAGGYQSRIQRNDPQGSERSWRAAGSPMPERAPPSALAGCRSLGRALSSACEAEPAGATSLCTSSPNHDAPVTYGRRRRGREGARAIQINTGGAACGPERRATRANVCSAGSVPGPQEKAPEHRPSCHCAGHPAEWRRFPLTNGVFSLHRCGSGLFRFGPTAVPDGSCGGAIFCFHLASWFPTPPVLVFPNLTFS